MRLRIPTDQVSALHGALRQAGNREIGGQIFGEQLDTSDFRATELTFQKRAGTLARFIVDLVQAARDATRFFDRTAHAYARFNYVGEWHSHPSFALRPSHTDVATMRALVADREFRGHFAVLMIVRLDGDDVTCDAWVFDPAGREQAVTLVLES